jgi:hypothetical protein
MHIQQAHVRPDDPQLPSRFRSRIARQQVRREMRRLLDLPLYKIRPALDTYGDAAE